MSQQDLLIELGTEELPPKALATLSEAFTSGIVQRLEKAGLSPLGVESYAAPRRLAVWLKGVPLQQPNQTIERRGPALKAAYDSDGNPSKALQGFARSCGANPEDLEQVETPKGTWLVFKSEQEGQTTVSLLPAFVEESLAALPIPKRMRWGASREEFVRPVHWILMLANDAVIPGTILGLETADITYGHRFHHPEAIRISSPDSYAKTLKEQGYVMASFADRKALIKEQVIALAAEHKGQAVIDESLLEEVASLNEWPVALLGNFEERFLEVPAEALISTMKENQKYFHLVDEQGKMLPYFITIANIESRDPSQVVAGNERVIRPRLADAEFFFKTDQKQRLEDRLESLKPVIFQQQLGSLYDKSIRVSSLAEKIASSIGGNANWAARAGKLSKADLMTEMVMEFTDLQGLMGRYYAQIDGEPEEVAIAMEEQYLPRFAGDQVPTTLTGCAVSLADKLDTLVGIFGINQPPTGTKDPFALRRAALGVLRILVDRKIDLNLADAIAWARDGYQTLPAENLEDTVIDYILERFRAWLEEEGMAVEIFMSVMARRPTNPLDFYQRVQAVSDFTALEEAEALAAANKRVSNILAKNAAPDSQAQVQTTLLQEEAEKTLFSVLQEKAQQVEPLVQKRDYSAALQALATLKQPVDHFFDDVMVMADDLELRNNRIALLSQLREVFLQIADISLLPTK